MGIKKGEEAVVIVEKFDAIAQELLGVDTYAATAYFGGCQSIVLGVS